MKNTTVDGTRFGNIQKTVVRDDGYGRSLLRLEADVCGKHIEMCSFNGGPVELYCRSEEGVHMFVGYLPYLMSTTDVWGRAFPWDFYKLWARVHNSKAGHAALDKKCTSMGVAH